MSAEGKKSLISSLGFCHLRKGGNETWLNAEEKELLKKLIRRRLVEENIAEQKRVNLRVEENRENPENQRREKVVVDVDAEDLLLLLRLWLKSKIFSIRSSRPQRPGSIFYFLNPPSKAISATFFLFDGVSRFWRSAGRFSLGAFLPMANIAKTSNSSGIDKILLAFS